MKKYFYIVLSLVIGGIYGIVIPLSIFYIFYSFGKCINSIILYAVGIGLGNFIALLMLKTLHEKDVRVTTFNTVLEVIQGERKRLGLKDEGIKAEKHEVLRKAIEDMLQDEKSEKK